MKPWIEHRRHTGWRPMPVTRMTVDPNVLDLSLADRAAFMLLWMVTDDAGRFSARPRELATRIGWPDSIRKLVSALRRLAATGYVRLYEVDGQQFGELADYAESAKLNNRQPAVYPAPSEGSAEPRGEAPSEAVPEASAKAPAQKEERRKEKEVEKPASSAGLSTGFLRERAYARPEAEGEARVSLPVSLDPSLSPRLTSEVDIADEVKWPSAQVAMAVRQWRGQLSAHQQGQRDVAHVTDVSLLGLVERWGADAFERAVVRHVGEHFKLGLWRTPFAALAKRCEWAADDVVEDSGIVRSSEAPPAPKPCLETPEIAEVTGAQPAWWPTVSTWLRAEMTGADWLTWVGPLRVLEHDSGVMLVCPDSAHASMVVERFGGRLAEVVPGEGPVVAVTPDGTVVETVRDRRAA